MCLMLHEQFVETYKITFSNEEFGSKATLNAVVMCVPRWTPERKDTD
jgi:hypothetical protein